MSETFNFSRFGKLLKSDFKDNLYLIFIPFAIFIGFSVYAGYSLLNSEFFDFDAYSQIVQKAGGEEELAKMLQTDNSNLATIQSMQKNVIKGDNLIKPVAGFLFILLGMIAYLCYFSGRAMRDYHQRAKASLMMTLPCSVFEKFLSRWTLFVFIVPMIYVIGYILVFGGSFHYLVQQFNDHGIPITSFIGTPMADKVNICILTSLLFISNASLYFAGSTFFLHKVGLKTTVIFIIFIIIALKIGVFDIISSASTKVSSQSEGINPTNGLLTFGGFLILTTGVAWLKFKRHTLP